MRLLLCCSGEAKHRRGHPKGGLDPLGSRVGETWVSGRSPSCPKGSCEYGVITRNFFDGGSVVHHPLMKGSFRIFRVTDIREIINPAYSGCSEQSYYECLELSLANMDVCTEHGGICEYISMPQSILPVCKSGMSFEQ